MDRVCTAGKVTAHLVGMSFQNDVVSLDVIESLIKVTLLNAALTLSVGILSSSVHYSSAPHLRRVNNLFIHCNSTTFSIPMCLFATVNKDEWNGML